MLSVTLVVKRTRVSHELRVSGPRALMGRCSRQFERERGRGCQACIAADCIVTVPSVPVLDWPVLWQRICIEWNKRRQERWYERLSQRSVDKGLEQGDAERRTVTGSTKCVDEGTAVGDGVYNRGSENGSSERIWFGVSVRAIHSYHLPLSSPFRLQFRVNASPSKNGKRDREIRWEDWQLQLQRQRPQKSPWW